jgi:Ca2+-binding RTX toxin-like protein
MGFKMNRPVNDPAISTGMQSTHSAESLGVGGPAPQVVTASGGSVDIPNTPLLQYGTYSQAGTDLVIQGPNGDSLVVKGYFAQTPPPELAGDNGFVLKASLVQTLAGVRPEIQLAENGDGSEALAQAAAPIGSVGKAQGTVTVTHADGTVETLNPGDPVYQGDILTTDSGASVGVVFVDGTEMSLGSKGRLVLDEMIYDPASGDGSSSFSLMSGAFSFVSGQIAKTDPDGMQITTPVATIGIRGTSGTVRIGDLSVDSDSQLQVILIPDPSGTVGEIIVTSTSGLTSTLNIPFGGLNLSTSSGAFQTFSISASDFVREYGSVINSLNSDFSNSLPQNNNDLTPNTSPDGTNDKQDGPTGEQNGDASDPTTGQGEAESQADEIAATPQGNGREQGATQGEGTQGPSQGSNTTQGSGSGSVFESSAIKVTIDTKNGGTSTGQSQGDGHSGSGGADNGTGNGNTGGNHNGSTGTGTGTGQTTEKDNDTSIGSNDEEQDNSLGGDTGQGGGSGEELVTSEGTVIDPYVSGATVFLDYDNDGILDSNEPWTTTDANGNYSLTGSDGATVVSIGGVDTTTGVVSGTMVAQSGSTVVTPLTTLISTMVTNGTAATAADAEASLKAALGLDSGLDLSTYDPVAGLSEPGAAGDTAALVLSVSMMVQNTLTMVSAALEGAGASATAAAAAAAAALSSALSTAGSRSILTSASDIESLLINASQHGAVSSAIDTAKITAALSGVSTAIASVSTAMENVISQGHPSDLTTQLSGIARVAQRDAVADIQSSVANGTADSLSSDYDEGTVASKAEAAQGEPNPNIIVGTTGADSLTGTSGDDQINGRDGADVINGGDGDDRLYGEGGNDTFIAGAGNDIIYGGSGVDRVDFSAISSDVTVDLSEGTASSSETGYDTLSSIEAVVGGSGNDTLIGSTAAEILIGGAGDDTIIGGGGADAIDGGQGTDTLDMSRQSDGVSVNLANGTFTADGASGTVANVEIVLAGDGDDTLIGSSAAETLIGGEGNDTISGGGGADYLDGGAGTNTLDLSANSSGVSVDLGSGTGTVSGESVSLTNFEIVQGGSGNDTLISSSGDDTLRGGDGNDTIRSGGGMDSLDGGAGVDTLDFSSASSDLTVDLSLGQASVDNDTSQVTNFEVVLGGSGNDTLIGSSSDETLRGGDGNDDLSGGGGNDLLDGGAGDDGYFYEGGDVTLTDSGGQDTLRLGSVVVLSATVSGNDLILNTDMGTLTLIGQAAETVFETLIGRGGNDILSDLVGFTDINGGEGNDQFSFVEGVNTYNGGDGIDTLDLSSQAGPVSVDLSSDRMVVQGQPATTIISIESVIGSDYNDTLIGKDNAETLAGGQGNDTYSGGGGNDTYIITSGNDLIVDSYGNDTLDLSATTLEGVVVADSELVITTGDGTVTINGQGTSVMIETVLVDGITYTLGQSTAGDDILYGANNGQTLNGGAGNDLLFSGDGITTVMNGGDGDDRFFLNHGDGSSKGPSVIYTGSGADTIVCDSGNSLTLDGAVLFSNGFLGLQLSNGNQVYVDDYASGLSTVELGGDSYDVTTGMTGSANADLMVVKISSALYGTAATLDAGDGSDIVMLSWSGMVSDLQGSDISWTPTDGTGGSPQNPTYFAFSESYVSLADTTISLGAGDDLLIIGGLMDGLDPMIPVTLIGPALIDGGAGTDTVEVASSTDFYYSTFVDVETLSITNGAQVSFRNGLPNGIETITGDGTGRLNIDLTSSNSLDLSAVTGIAGATISAVEAGAVSIVGSSGDDTISVSFGSNTIDGGDGADTILGGSGGDTILYDSADSTISGGEGRDILVVSEGLDMTSLTNVSGIDVLELNITDGSTVVIDSAWILANTDSGALYLGGFSNGEITGAAGWELDTTQQMFINSTVYNIYNNGGAVLYVPEDTSLDISAITGADPGTDAPVLTASAEYVDVYAKGSMVVMDDVTLTDNPADSQTLTLNVAGGIFVVDDLPAAITATGVGTDTLILSGSQLDISTFLANEGVLLDSSAIADETITVSYSVVDGQSQTASTTITYNATSEVEAVAEVQGNSYLESNDNHGYDVAVISMHNGDLNGDGIDDLVIEYKGKNGSGADSEHHTSIIFGSGDGLPSYVDMSEMAANQVAEITDLPFDNGITDSRIIGLQDFNGDGFDDLLLVSQYSTEQTMTVVFGSSSGLGGSNSLSSLSQAQITLDSTALNAASLAMAGSSGDLNGDGYADVALFDDRNVQVVFGSSLGAGSYATTTSLAEANSSSGTLLSTAIDLDGVSGSIDSVVIGDITGDGIDDLIVTMTYNNESSQTLIFDGSTVTKGGVLTHEDALWTVSDDSGKISYGVLSDSYMGDINGDGIDDLILSGNGSSNRQTRVIFGNNSASGETTTDSLASSNGILDLTAYSPSNTVETGTAIAVGDINGDGIDDLAIAVSTQTSGADPRAYEVYMVLGNTTLSDYSTLDLRQMGNDHQALRLTVDSQYGRSVSLAMADMTGDGFDDLVITIAGEYGDDVIVLDRDSLINRTSNLIVGSAGNDTLTDSSGDDVIVGGAGNDTLISDAGKDTLNGGDGIDTVSFAGRSMAVSVMLANGRFYDDVSFGKVVDVENVIGTSYGDTLIGSLGAETLLGGDGNDMIDGNRGADMLDGGAGNDTIIWNADATSIVGGAGTDTLVVESNGDTLELGGASTTNGFEQVVLSGVGTTLTLNGNAVHSSASGSLVIQGDSGMVTGAAAWTGGSIITDGGAEYYSFTNSSGEELTISTDLVVDGLLDTESNGVFVQDMTVVSGATSVLTAIELGDMSGLAGSDTISLTLSVDSGSLSASGNAGTVSFTPSGPTSFTVSGTLSNVLDFINRGAVLYEGGTPGMDATLTVTLTHSDSSTTTSTASITTSSDAVALAHAYGNEIGGIVASDGELPYDGMLSGDFNGDGYQDLVLTSTDGDGAVSASILFGSAEATASASHMDQALTLNNLDITLDEVLRTISSLAVGDLNDDGIDDLILGASSNGAAVISGAADLSDLAGQTIDMNAAQTGSYVSYYAYGNARQIENMITGDFNGDGVTDLVINYGGSSGSGAIYYGDPTSTEFSLSSPDLTVSYDPMGESQSMGDFNADGFDDLVWSSAGASIYAVQGNNNSDDTQIMMGWSASTSDSLIVDLSGDFNGDGFADLLVIDQSAHAINILSGNENGFVDGADIGQVGQTINTSASLIAFAADYAVGDLNGDGLDDLALFSLDSDGVTGRLDVLFGRSDGVWGSIDGDSNGLHLTTTAGGLQNSQLTIADTDNDGFADIVFTSQDSESGTSVVQTIAGGDFTNQAAYIATDSGGTYMGTSADELIIGGSGSDTLAAQGTDILRGLGGNDVFHILTDNATSTIDGGTGLDRVILDSTVSTDASNWENIDVISLTGGNALSIDTSMLVRMVNGDNDYALSTGVLGDAANNMLVVSGDATSSITITGLTVVDSGVTLGSDGESYTVYQDSSSAARLYVDSDIAVNGGP